MAVIRPKVIALGDLGHTTKLLANNFVPLNIGFIAAYLEARFGSEVAVHLFKDPDRLLRFVDDERPDLVATSNYAWNEKIGLYALRRYKAARPDGIAVLGGPNFAKDDAGMRAWLTRYPFVDFAVENEGESSMAGLVARLFETGFRAAPARELPISGVFSLDEAGGLCRAPFEMMRDLDDIPSPYLSGLLDRFLLQDTAGFTLIPMIEGSRGCPFACTFCRAGIETNKIRTFSTGRVMEEIDYIGRLYRRHDRRVAAMLVTDQNFGILRRDIEIADKLRTSFEATGFPVSVMATSGKTNADVVLETISRYDGIAMTMSVQSMDEDVLRNIKRKNFPVEKFMAYQAQLKKHGKLSKSDIIVGLPGDTYARHLDSLRTVLNIGLDVIDPFTFMMLRGTEAEMRESREKYEYVTRWRLLPGGFSRFGNDTVLESEEVAVATNTQSFEEYVRLRRVHLLLVTVCNGTVFRDLKKLIRERGLDIVDFLLRLEDYLSEPARLAAAPEGAPPRVLEQFEQKTRSELFESLDALESYYRRAESYDDLLCDRAGENLLQKHRYALISQQEELAEAVLTVLRGYLSEHEALRPEDECVFALARSRSQAMGWLLDGRPVRAAAPLHFEVETDVLAWLASDGRALGEFSLRKPITLCAYHPDPVIESFERTIADGGTRDFEKARTLYRLGIEALLPTIVRGDAADAAAVRAEGRAQELDYVPKFLGQGD